MSDPNDRKPRSPPPQPGADYGSEAGGNPYDNARNFGRRDDE
jgi:hypothetical protein